MKQVSTNIPHGATWQQGQWSSTLHCVPVACPYYVATLHLFAVQVLSHNDTRFFTTMAKMGDAAAAAAAATNADKLGTTGGGVVNEVMHDALVDLCRFYAKPTTNLFLPALQLKPSVCEQGLPRTTQPGAFPSAAALSQLLLGAPGGLVDRVLVVACLALDEPAYKKCYPTLKGYPCTLVAREMALDIVTKIRRQLRENGAPLILSVDHSVTATALSLTEEMNRLRRLICPWDQEPTVQAHVMKCLLPFLNKQHETIAQLCRLLAHWATPPTPLQTHVAEANNVNLVKQDADVEAEARQKQQEADATLKRKVYAEYMQAYYAT
eukprot:223033_1